jgi:hypothetical protein
MPEKIAPINLERVVNLPKNKLWSMAVSNLAKTFFVINNIEPASGYINLSYSGDPEGFVDCGSVHFHNLTGGYDFDVASNSTEIPSAQRKISMDGRANIIIQEAGTDKSRVTVNVRYVIHQDFMQVSIDGLFGTNENHTLNGAFNSNQLGRLGNFTCLPTGKMEEKILGLISDGHDI